MRASNNSFPLQEERPAVDLTVRVIAYNCRPMLQDCLFSLYRKIPLSAFEVIVVDNHSVDGTAEMVKRQFPQALLIENPVNRGVSRARNQAIHRAKGRYILILDADTEIISENFQALIEYMDQHKEIGLLGCSLASADGRLHPSARTFPRPLHIILRRLLLWGVIKKSRTLNAHHLTTWDRKRPREVDFVEGAFQLVRRKAISKVGVLDEKMFYGFEDADYCARMRKTGYQVVCYPSFIVTHHLQGLTRKHLLSRLTCSHAKSYLRFYIKHLLFRRW